MSNSVEIIGAEKILKVLGNFSDQKKLEMALGQACAIVEGAAKENAPKGDGHLRDSITFVVEGNKGIVFTPLEYAPYVEYGTGLFREENPQAGYWIYVIDKEGSSKKAGKRYSLEQAKRIVAIMRSKGLNAVYTQGQHPHPFLRPALEENREAILKILKEGITND